MTPVRVLAENRKQEGLLRNVGLVTFSMERRTEEEGRMV